jgi:hypothetical protein
VSANASTDCRCGYDGVWLPAEYTYSTAGVLATASGPSGTIKNGGASVTATPWKVTIVSLECRSHLAAAALAVIVTLSAGSATAAIVTLGANHEIRVDGQPFLPIMVWLQCPSFIAHEKTLGINTFVADGCSGAAADYLAECSAQGVWAVLDTSDLSVKNHPRLLGWIFGDEPDLQGNQVEPATLKAEYDNLKAQDTSHLAFTTLTAGFYSEETPPAWMSGDRSRYYAYPNATDVLGFDIYPVYGWCRPDWLYQVGAAQAELALTYAPSRATYQWIEAVKTSSQWCQLPARGTDDGPYPEEIRNEVFQALIHGATAIGYFTHSWECPGYTQLCLSAAQETELTRTNGQLTALAPAILSPTYESNLTLQLTGGAKVDAVAKHASDGIYVFAANLERASDTVGFTLTGMRPGSVVQVVDEARTLTAVGETFTDTFQALEVHIYIVQSAATAADGGLGPGDPGPGAGDPWAAPGEHATAGSGLTSGCSCSAPPPALWLLCVAILGWRRRR